MRSVMLAQERDLRTFMLVMDQGDEAFAEISRFAEQHAITAASLTAIGAGTSITLGYFDPAEGDYRYTTFDEQVELASCIGDIADLDGAPVLHAHVVAGRRDSSAIAGHLKSFHVFPTMEVVLTETPARLRKRIDPATGLALIAVGDSTASEPSNQTGTRGG